MRVPLCVPGGGVWGRAQVREGGCFPLENERKGEGGVESAGWGGDGQRNPQVNEHAYPSANYPLNSSRAKKMVHNQKCLWSKLGVAT